MIYILHIGHSWDFLLFSSIYIFFSEKLEVTSWIQKYKNNFNNIIVSKKSQPKYFYPEHRKHNIFI